MTDLARLDGRGAAAVSDQLVAVYRAAMGAAPFFETEVEAGWFAEELAGEVEEDGYRCWWRPRTTGWSASPTACPRPRSPPTAGTAWSGRPSARPPPSAGWPASSPWSGSPSTPTTGGGLGRRLLERLLAEAGTDRAWLITHDLDSPARALYRSLGFLQLGHGPLGWRDADQVVLGAELPPASPPVASGP